MDNHLKIGAQNWNNYDLDPAIMLKCSCSAFFFKIMSNKLVIFVTHFFHRLNIKESKKKNIVHKFHEQPPQNRSTKSKKSWFGPLQLCLSAHVMYFFKIMSNTLMIFITHFFHSLNIKESKNIYIMHRFYGQPPQNKSTK